ncbi:hypothetical protein KGM_209991 [Danaus plexippus plexippus]|uniref:Uncharacterized protein n=1 Tax=Danaus plexippus plexippus TaxID=278856 RepID=A0A212FHU2_DANPL|nr:hypothetical protein KGM_209991 [Danaus plexippus plexippus]
MPRKRESDFTRSSSRARAAKVARTQESEKQIQARQILDAERHAAARPTETSKLRPLQLLDIERYAFHRATETLEQTQTRQFLDDERHASLRVTETLEQTQARQLSCMLT